MFRAAGLMVWIDGAGAVLLRRCHQSKALYRRHTVSGHRVVSDDALAGSLLVGSCGAARTHVESRGPRLVHWVRLTPGSNRDEFGRRRWTGVEVVGEAERVREMRYAGVLC